MDNIRRVFKAINDYSKLAKRETGLTSPQLWALKVLFEHAPLRVNELAQRMYLHPSTVVGIVDRLEHHGLVKRQRETRDRRAVKVSLTPSAKVLVSKVPAVAQGLLLAGLDKLSDRQVGLLARGLELQVKLLGAQEIPPQLILSPHVNLPTDGAGSTRHGSTRSSSRARARD